MAARCFPVAKVASSNLVLVAVLFLLLLIFVRLWWEGRGGEIYVRRITGLVGFKSDFKWDFFAPIARLSVQILRSTMGWFCCRLHLLCMWTF